MCSGCGAAGIFAAGAEAAEALLQNVYRIDVAKALDPLVDSDFMVICVRLAKALDKAVRGDEAVALRAAIEALDVDWVTMSEAGRDRVIQSARQQISVLPPVVAPKVEDVLRVRADSLISATKQGAIEKYGFSIAGDFDRYDRRTSDFLVRSHGLYIKDEYGRRADALDAYARKVVTDGLEAGLGSEDISAKLAKDVRLAYLGRVESYWEVIATAFANHARTATQINSFQEAGVITYKFVAVLDQVTTDICRYMDGRTFSTAEAAARQRQIETVEDPEEIKSLRPWVNRGVDGSGNDVLYYKKGEERITVARIEHSAVGLANAIGSFSHGLSDAQLEAAGLSIPPLHGRCRSTIIVD